MLSFSHKKLVNILICLFFKNWSTFPGQSLELSPIFCCEQRRICVFFPSASEMKAGAEDPPDILEEFLFMLCVSPIQWMSAFWDGSWWQRLLGQGEVDGHVLHDQDPKGMEALCRAHTLSQAGSQQLHDCCRCGVFPGAMGGGGWYKGRNISAYRAAWLNSHKSWLDTKWQC